MSSCSCSSCSLKDTWLHSLLNAIFVYLESNSENVYFKFRVLARDYKFVFMLWNVGNWNSIPEIIRYLKIKIDHIYIWHECERERTVFPVIAYYNYLKN